MSKFSIPFIIWKQNDIIDLQISCVFHSYMVILSVVFRWNWLVTCKDPKWGTKSKALPEAPLLSNLWWEEGEGGQGGWLHPHQFGDGDVFQSIMVI